MITLTENMKLLSLLPPNYAKRPVDVLVMLQQVPKDKITMQKFRRGGFINRDYDMGRVCIDLPIIEAKKLLAALKAV